MEVDAERGRSRSEIAKSATRSTASSSVRMREQKRPPCGGLSGGPSRARTDGLRHAMAALSQLSYGPQRGLRNCSAELVMACEPDSNVLVVLRRRNAKMDLEGTVDHLEGDQVTALELRAERRKSIELTVNVRPSDQPAPRPTTGVRPDDDDLTVQWRPLALDSKQSLTRVEDQVISAPFDYRPVDVVLHFEARLHNRCLGDRALLIRRQHGQHSTRTAGRTVAAKGNVSV
jgi:hypothetical protein